MLKWLEEFKQHLAAKGWSPVTIKGTAESLRVFEGWLGKIDPTGVTTQTLKDYGDYLAQRYRTKDGKPLRYETVSHRLLAVRIYFGFLAKRRLILFDPAAALPRRPKMWRMPDYVPSEREMERLLGRPCPEEHHGIRDAALLELAYSAGLRRKELALLELGDVDMKEQFAKVRHGKGGKERVVPFGRRAKGALETYLRITRSRWQMGSDLECPRFFLTERGRGLSLWTVSEITAKHRPNRKIHTHSLRHACALHMLRSGANIRHIQELLGHASPNTTRIYTRLFPADMKAMHDRYHPRERLHERAKTEK